MSNGDFKYAGAVGSRKSVYLKDVDKYEEELATSNTDSADNADTLENENPNPEKPVNHDWEKRHSDLKSYMDKQINTITAALTQEKQEKLELQKQLKEASKKTKTYPVSEDEISEWAKQFPDFYKTLVSIIEKSTDQKAEELRQEMASLEESQKAVAAEKGRAELLKLHPDAFDIDKDPRFATWFAEQELEVRKLIESPNPRAIAKGLSLYKKDMGIETPQKNNSEKEASKGITLQSQAETPRDKKRWSESEVDRMHPKTYAKFEKEIDLARAEGRFDYDLSSL